MDPSSLFSLTDHLNKLSKDGDRLEVLDATVDFEYFRTWLAEGLGYGDGAKAGHQPFDPVSRHRVTQFSGYGNPKPRCLSRVRVKNCQKVSVVNPMPNFRQPKIFGPF